MSHQAVGTAVILLLVVIPSAAYLLGHRRGERHAETLTMNAVQRVALGIDNRQWECALAASKIAVKMVTDEWGGAATVPLPVLPAQHRPRHAEPPYPGNSTGHWYRQPSR